MKKLIALLLAVCLLAIPVSAETVKGESDTVEAPVLTVGAEEEQVEEMELPTVYGEEVLVEEMDLPTVYGEEELIKDEMEYVTVYGEEETGFLGWLKNLWNSILNFFGL